MSTALPVLANVVWPALILLDRLVSIYVILAGLALEYFFVWRHTGLGAARSFVANILMNTVSLVLGLLLIPLVGFMVVVPLPATFGDAAWVLTYVAAVLINTFVESLVLIRFARWDFERPPIRFRWLAVANGLSVGVALASLAYWPIRW
jgi:hypothetical protein